jgi:hypothetical protein
VTEYGVVLFFTTASALRSERVLMDAGVQIKLIPTPREFSSDCGLACRFAWADRDQVKKAINEAAVEISGIQAMGETGNGK